ncbi:MAG TPA: VWA domain-containing protein [Pyrinomonadaceae bacterium]|jgi:Ca-activated chloride channel family protein|nr:VWA domain-containing protein [Pyrinomonadaceae bacterium]
MNPRPPTAPRRHAPPPGRVSPLPLLLLLALTILFPPVAAAQDETPADEDEVVRVNSDLVAVPVYVTDGKGRRVAGLSRADFEVRDNGRPVEVAYFAAGAERVALLFLLDASGSVRETVTQQSEAALAIFSRFGRRSRVGVMQFSDSPKLVQPLTQDLISARRAFRIASEPDSRTAIFDAALAAVRAFAAGASDAAERRIVILLSDGLDTASASNPRAVVAAARAAGVSFYCIHVPLYEPRGDRLAPRRPTKGFKELAEQTGGQFFSVGDTASALDPNAEHDLRPVFRAIAEDLAAQYVLGYHASAAGREPGAHRIEVRLSTPARKLRVRQLREAYEARMTRGGG